MTNQQLIYRMRVDMRLRGMADNTQDSYLRYARKFLEFCDKPAQDLDELDARRYLLYLLHETKQISFIPIATGTANQPRFGSMKLSPPAPAARLRVGGLFLGADTDNLEFIIPCRRAKCKRIFAQFT